MSHMTKITVNLTEETVIYRKMSEVDSQAIVTNNVTTIVEAINDLGTTGIRGSVHSSKQEGSGPLLSIFYI